MTTRPTNHHPIINDYLSNKRKKHVPAVLKAGCGAKALVETNAKAAKRRAARNERRAMVNK
jgi:hypothetical protein